MIILVSSKATYNTYMKKINLFFLTFVIEVVYVSLYISAYTIS